MTYFSQHPRLLMLSTKMAAVQRPRAAKQQSETGLLMSVIRTLSASEDFEQREVEKQRLEKAFKECDSKLDKLVEENYDDLTATVNHFSTISTSIHTCRDRMQAVRQNLKSCKSLLRCKRDELRKLWIEGIEHKQILSLLQQIENVKQTPEKLDEYMAKKHYLHATELLVSAVASLEGTLSGVEALRDVRAELQNKKEQMHEVLIEELHRHLYIRSTAQVNKPLRRQGSIKGTANRDVSPSPARKLLQQGSRSLDYMSPGAASGDDDPAQVQENMEGDPEADSVQFMSVLVESLSILQKIPETVEAIKSRMEKEMTLIVHRTTSQVLDNAEQRGETATQQNQPRLLLELFELLFEKFRCVAQAHDAVLMFLQRISNSASHGQAEFELYGREDVWSRIQAVLQLVLNDYLDVKNTASASQNQGPSAYTDAAVDISTYFTKKRHQKVKKYPLFKFEMSSHAISMNNYLREQKRKKGGLGEPDLLENGTEVQYVCEPGAKNITVIFNTLQRFVKEIEVTLQYSSGARCQLHDFLTEYIKTIFLGQVHMDVNKNIQQASRGAEALKLLTDAQTMKTMGLQRPLLQSTITVERCLAELRELMYALPAYSDHFLSMICKMLQDYRDMCQSAYRGVVQRGSEEQRIISATWAKDEDISRLLRSLPNWQNLENRRARKDDEVENPEAVRARNTKLQRDRTEERIATMWNNKESDLLTNNLGDSLIPKYEVLQDVNDLRVLANLHESLEWFAGRIRSFNSTLPLASPGMGLSPASSDSSPSDLQPVSPATLASLTSLAREFQDLAETCLLVLHLEVRVHCFFFLLPMAKQSNYSGNLESTDPDPLVVKLNKDLSSIEESLTTSLNTHKFRYIFEGLGHQMSSILVNSTQYFNRISHSGIKKMCRNIFALQQNLTNITMSREVDLDHARQYYETLYMTVEEILNSLVEQGVHFTELEYVNALNLLQRSTPGTDAKAHAARLWRLKEIMAQKVGNQNAEMTEI
ncbi:EXOC4 [Branchiostoma lanceolatum]|uniref:Exocyst complex component Sec8 n=1 Tax=Branchiostoma lanceolatum TaxID=7740 RepID=A0A8S4MP39_BRALA|nr:EXOC4 [Branchiostoma lanceolatum]